MQQQRTGRTGSEGSGSGIASFSVEEGPPPAIRSSRLCHISSLQQAGEVPPPQQQVQSYRQQVSVWRRGHPTCNKKQ